MGKNAINVLGIIYNDLDDKQKQITFEKIVEFSEVKDMEMRSGAIRAMGNLYKNLNEELKPIAFNRIIKGFNDKDLEVRIEILDILGQIYTKLDESLKRLTFKKSVEKHKDENVQIVKKRIDFLGKIYQTLDNEEKQITFNIITKIFGDKNSDIRDHVKEVLLKNYNSFLPSQKTLAHKMITKIVLDVLLKLFWRKERAILFTNQLHKKEVRVKTLAFFIKKLPKLKKKENKIIFEYISQIAENNQLGFVSQFTVLDEFIKASEFVRKTKDRAILKRFGDLLYPEIELNIDELKKNSPDIFQYLGRHEDIRSDCIQLLAKYHSYLEGKFYRSKLAEKENKLIEKGVEVNPKQSRRFEKKFVEDLCSNVELVRYNAFVTALKNIWHSALKAVVGDEIPEGLCKSKNLERAIIGCYQERKMIEHIRHMDKEKEVDDWEREQRRKALLFREMVKRHVKGELDNKWIWELEENNGIVKVLEKKYNLKAWREGCEHVIKVIMRKDVQKKLKEKNKAILHEIGELCIKHGLKIDDLLRGGGSIEVKTWELDRFFKKNLSKVRDGFVRQEIQTLLNNLSSNVGQFQTRGGKVFFRLCQNPVEALNMASGFSSCLQLDANNVEVLFNNVVDVNKHVAYAYDEEGKRIGRVLLVLTDKGILTFRFYDNTTLDLRKGWLEFLVKLGEELDAKVFIPEGFAKDSGIVELLRNHGAKEETDLEFVVRMPTFCEWYDDIKMRKVMMNSGEKRHKIKCKTYSF